MSVPRSVFLLRRGVLGFRRSDVVAALEEQRRQIEALSADGESLLREKDHAWHAARVGPGDGERAAAARLDEISAKLDRLLGESDRPNPPGPADQVEQRHVYVSELGDLGEVRARRIALRGSASRM